jgi:site-specific recombinase XerD
VRRLAKEADLQVARCNPHSFRHAFARDTLMTRKCDISQLSRLLGYTTPTITMKYYLIWDEGELQDTHDATSPALSLGEPPSIE